MGDPLARLDNVVDWGVFELLLQDLPKAEPRGPGGRPAFPPLLLFKAMLIGTLYNLSDAQVQFQITDRHSFKRFLGTTDADKAPDEKTLWAFRQRLVESDLQQRLFDAFHAELDKRGLFARKGQMVDATFVEVPRQRNSRDENAGIKDGRVPEGWEEQRNMLRQKDMDARWTKKREQVHYGYKNHVKVDSKSKLIDSFVVTDASLHDSGALDALIERGDPPTYADSAYVGPRCDEIFRRRGVEARVIERAYKSRALTGRQKRSNRAKSRVRVRVEHVFGTMRMCMRAQWNRCIGMARNRASVAMTNLVYNLVRFEQILRLRLPV
jgi:transposase, IS5 family